MKNLNYLKKTAILLIGLILIASCDSDDNNSPQALNIVETAQSVPELSILVEAAIKANLVDALTSSGDKTILAPTNAAFSAFLANKGFSSLSEVPNDILNQILLNHVIDGTNITSSSLIGNTGYTNTLADGPNTSKLSIYFNGTSGVVFNGEATVTTPDIQTSNGIVHIIDKVIDLPSIATFATTNSDLSSLVSALAYADTGNDPSVEYINTVSDIESGPFTVFAPTNDAFSALLTELNVNALTDIPAATVDAVLLQHIVNANVQSSQLTSGSVTTLGGTITANATTFTLTDANGRMSNIVTTLVDIQAANGVVHVIDKVLLPQQPQ
ncbi:beta-Ig-H3/fasciclin [Pseudalgibacter alginicilyticus]|uniref:Beta-Ig-H3/fasciclin n=1 Tax=Pseudalgibacter alginicilyticus TaxID=1736674 RepID=A0A0P0CNL8_9FLAO|nr:fasciclin domain-containing protein [Pseudalgibacter alginicilyticus]ALJ04420.1 beta-Ig-H3/fasciclin [Pseudalgibacter alginicilyticus]